MIQGQPGRFSARLLLGLLLAGPAFTLAGPAFTLLGSHAAAASRRAPALELTGTLLTANADSWTVQGDDGRLSSVQITGATWFVKGGLPVAARAFVPGEEVKIRLARSAKSPMRALLVCDPQTAADLERRRGHALAGTILSADTQVWTLAPADGTAPALVCLSPRTAFSAAGSPVTAAAFGSGASVVITTRALPSGLPSAVSVSEGDGSEPEAAAPSRRSVSGIVLEVDAAAGLLSVQDKAGGTLTLATNARTRVKVRKRAASLGDITAGMHVSARLGVAGDAAGNPLAVSVSASL